MMNEFSMQVRVFSETQLHLDLGVTEGVAMRCSFFLWSAENIPSATAKQQKGGRVQCPLAPRDFC